MRWWGSTGHRYLSTACFHDNHAQCQAKTNHDGDPKVPATCTWCSAPCVCDCHQQPTERLIQDKQPQYRAWIAGTEPDAMGG